MSTDLKALLARAADKELGHKLRMSDSSRYDVRCIACCGTDAHGDDRLDHWCRIYGPDPRLELEKMAPALAEAVVTLQGGQTYRYIGRDGKVVLARELEDRIEELEEALRVADVDLGEAEDKLHVATFYINDERARFMVEERVHWMMKAQERIKAVLTKGVTRG